MGKFNSNCVICLSISLFFFACIRTATSFDPPTEICANKNCGQGRCLAAGASPIGFECDCNPGWTTIQFGFVTIPTCIIPNCTINFNCGASTPTPPPGFVLPPPQIDFSNPCALVWCVEGICVANGAAYTCQCNKDATNLLNMPGLPCFKECFLGADCNNLGLGPLPNQTLQQPPPPPPSNCTASGASGGASGAYWMKNKGRFIMIVLATSLLTWVS